MGYGIFAIVVLVLMFVSQWVIFTKLGLPGWMGIIPFVSTYMIYKARGQRSPVVWLILSLVPFIAIVAWWFLCSDLAEMFGKGTGWKIFLFLIPGLAHLILAFGGSEADRRNIALAS